MDLMTSSRQSQPSRDDNEDKAISRAYTNGVTTTYEYFNNDLLKRMKDFNSTATLFDRQYTYNNANQIATLTDNSGTRTFGYDLVDRLKTVTVSTTQTEFYNFDHVGNRTNSHLSSTYGYAPGKYNQLTSTDTATMQYDANGNTIQKSEGNTFWRYTWDGENRLTEAATRKQKVRYKYDALGRRVRRYTPGVREDTKFTNDGQDVLIDDDAGSLTKYLNGPGIDNKLRVQTGSSVNYFLADHLGSTNGLADPSGALGASTTYDSFGNSTITNFPSRYRFTGREVDSFSGLQFSRARFYDSTLGRFISEDPIGFRGGDVNLYGYVKNDPTLWKDPLGLDLYGVVGGGSIWGGAGIGAGGTASVAVGYGSDGLGSAASYGHFVGPGQYAMDTKCNTGAPFGGGGGIGAGVFWSNADNWDQFGGDFGTTIYGLGPIGSIEIDAGDNGVYVVQVYPGPLGKGQNYGVVHLRTTTPATGRFSDAVNDSIYKFRQGMGNVCGCRL
ncbi:MAG: RHS repeat-associated core domain-containing protein [Acidobacteria bacterium]|nr:RHS repeat-associated core domain-containing protein [Acidobacteriota bacterium]